MGQVSTRSERKDCVLVSSVNIMNRWCGHTSTPVQLAKACEKSVFVEYLPIFVVISSAGNRHVFAEAEVLGPWLLTIMPERGMYFVLCMVGVHSFCSAIVLKNNNKQNQQQQHK